MLGLSQFWIGFICGVASLLFARSLIKGDGWARKAIYWVYYLIKVYVFRKKA